MNLEEEVKIVQSLDHKHVVKYFDFKMNSTMIEARPSPVQNSPLFKQMEGFGLKNSDKHTSVAYIVQEMC